ncbi:MAG: SPOR domain-containing protein [Desulfobacterales bacterium]|nr:SPOR domain-containing protein [Desulfobacterales bacterium]
MKTAVFHWATILMVVATAFLLPTQAGAVDETNWYEKGSELLKAHQYQEAIDAFSTAVETIPHDYQAYSKRGAARYLKGDYAEAIADYHTALGMNPDDAVALHQLAVILTFCPDPAFQNLSQALISAQRAVDLMYAPIFIKTLAAIQYEAGEIEAAVHTQEKLIALTQYLGQTIDLPAMEAQLSEYRKKSRKFGQLSSNMPEDQDVGLPPPHKDPVRVNPYRSRKKPNDRAPETHAFTIHLHSFQDRDKANRTAQSLRSRGEAAFVSHVDIPKRGRWFRVYVGSYSLESEAMKHAIELRRQKLPYARAVQRPWAVRVGLSGRDATLADLDETLLDRGYLTHPLQTGGPGKARLYGAFATENDAEAAARELKTDGFDATAVAQ